MKNILVLLLSCMTLVNCNSKSKSVNKIERKPYFQYDAIDYYHNPFDERNVGELIDNRKKSKNDSFAYGMLIGDIPKDISDLSFINKLNGIGYKMRKINNSDFEPINKIFTAKSVSEQIATTCIYVYRDVLIFKRNNNVIGTAKVCLSCLASQIHGTRQNIENFGQDGDYSRLGSLLKKYW